MLCNMYMPPEQYVALAGLEHRLEQRAQAERDDFFMTYAADRLCVGKCFLCTSKQSRVWSYHLVKLTHLIVPGNPQQTPQEFSPALCGGRRVTRIIYEGARAGGSAIEGWQQQQRLQATGNHDMFLADETRIQDQGVRANHQERHLQYSRDGSLTAAAQTPCGRSARLLTAFGDIVSLDEMKPSQDGRFSTRHRSKRENIRDFGSEKPSCEDVNAHVPAQISGQTRDRGSQGSLSSYLGDGEDVAPEDAIRHCRHPDQDSLDFVQNLRFHNLTVGREKARIQAKDLSGWGKGKTRKSSSRVQKLEAMWHKGFEDWPQSPNQHANVDQISICSWTASVSGSESASKARALAASPSSTTSMASAAPLEPTASGAPRKRSDVPAPGSSQWAKMAIRGDSHERIVADRLDLGLDAQFLRIAGVDPSAGIILARNPAKQLEALEDTAREEGGSKLLYAHSWDS